jgi:hypothetical protein
MSICALIEPADMGPNFILLVYHQQTSDIVSLVANLVEALFSYEVVSSFLHNEMMFRDVVVIGQFMYPPSTVSKIIGMLEAGLWNLEVFEEKVSKVWGMYWKRWSARQVNAAKCIWFRQFSRLPFTLNRLSLISIYSTHSVLRVTIALLCISCSRHRI